MRMVTKAGVRGEATRPNRADGPVLFIKTRAVAKCRANLRQKFAAETRPGRS
jgi:hypothetical protein